MRNALRDITSSVERYLILKGDVVLDIGSNDGTLLKSYSMPGLIKVGVEPADNLVEEGRQGLDHHIHDFGILMPTMKLYIKSKNYYCDWYVL